MGKATAMSHAAVPMEIEVDPIPPTRPCPPTSYADQCAIQFDWTVDQAKLYGMLDGSSSLTCGVCHRSASENGGPLFPDSRNQHYCLQCWASELAHQHECVFGLYRDHTGEIEWACGPVARKVFVGQLGPLRDCLSAPKYSSSPFCTFVFAPRNLFEMES